MEVYLDLICRSNIFNFIFNLWKRVYICSASINEAEVVLLYLCFKICHFRLNCEKTAFCSVNLEALFEWNFCVCKVQITDIYSKTIITDFVRILNYLIMHLTTTKVVLSIFASLLCKIFLQFRCIRQMLLVILQSFVSK